MHGLAGWHPDCVRAKANYYTTSFKTDQLYTNDYCQFATDCMSDPEDGTTEQVNGSSPAASTAVTSLANATQRHARSGAIPQFEPQFDDEQQRRALNG